MKKSTLGFAVIIILVVMGIISYGGGSGSSSMNDQATTTASIPVSVTSKVSDKFSKYSNSELGFSVNYPTAWEVDRVDTGVSFVMPIDSAQVSTVNKLSADITVLSSKCAFPPVTTIKDRATVTVGSLSFNMISISNTVQGRTYFNRMYSLEKDGSCFFFSFSSITASPATKKLTGSNLVQAENNNKAIINTADTAFTEMVKSFTFISGPQGEDETKAVPVKK